MTKKEREAMDNCDRCKQEVDHLLSYHIGTYAEQVELNYTPYYCKACFKDMLQHKLKLLNKEETRDGLAVR